MGRERFASKWERRIGVKGDTTRAWGSGVIFAWVLALDDFRGTSILGAFTGGEQALELYIGVAFSVDGYSRSSRHKTTKLDLVTA